jgi:hypothetical protein
MRPLILEVREALAKVPDAFAERRADLRKSLRSEDDQCQGQDNQELW